MCNVAVSILTPLQRMKKFSSSVPCVSQPRARARAHAHTLTHRHTRARKSRLCRNQEPTRSKAAWEDSPGVSSEADTCQGREARKHAAVVPSATRAPFWPSGRDLQIPPLERLWQLHNGLVLKVCPLPATRRPFLRFPTAPKSTRDRWGEGGGARDICRGSLGPAPGRDPQSTDATAGWPDRPPPRRSPPRPQGAARTGRAR